MDAQQQPAVGFEALVEVTEVLLDVLATDRSGHVVTGLGKTSEFTARSYRDAVSAAMRALAGTKVQSIVNYLSIEDLGSTNGIEYNGMRIDNKRIEEGDVFHICDYELRFSYQ